MDLLDRLLGHDRWTTRELLRRCEGLTDAQLDAEFDVGLRTVRATLVHVIGNMEIWSGLMAGRTPTELRAGPRGASIADLTARLEAAAASLASIAADVRDRAAWDDTWTDVLDEPPTEKTYGGAIAHVVTHSMHHRCQLIHMLRRLGVEDVPEGDALTWESVHARRGG